ncbi:YeeE/YedE family protein [Sulfitobacter sp. LCG007]
MIAHLLEPWLAPLFGAFGGVILGLAARLGRFCTLGAVEDHLYGNSDHRLRMCGLAIGVATLTSFGLAGAGYADLASSVYLAPGWNPAAHVVGGGLFGVGMALAGNCGFGALARLGGGDLRAFVIVLVMGISAYVVMSGPLAFLRLRIFPPDLIQTAGPAGYAHAAAAALGVPVHLAGILSGIAVVIVSIARRSFRAERGMVLWAIAVGLAVTYGWVASTRLAGETFGAVEIQSYTFSAPLGESILFAMRSTGTAMTFAVGGVVGVWTGALVGSLIKGHFRWEACEDPRELRRLIFGAMLMGSGAVIAGGCTIGQGISAFSVLSYGAPLTLAGIYVGASLGLRTLIAGFNAA